MPLHHKRAQRKWAGNRDLGDITQSMSRQYTTVPELSLKVYTDGSPSERKAFEDALYEGFRYFGFIILKDHSVSPELLARAYALSAKFFELPNDTKMRFSRKDGQRGYTPFGREHAKDNGFSDLKEFWHVGRELEHFRAKWDPVRVKEMRPNKSLERFHDSIKLGTALDAGSAHVHPYPSNMWPEGPDGFRETFMDLYEALEATGKVMLDALAPSLDVHEDYFHDMVMGGNSILRLLHYPPIADDADPNCIRAAAHEDINLITILVAANGAGLELLDRDGKWLPVETDPGNLIVDAGDMLARICNDRIPATTHRVINPVGPNISRYSMPFFMHPRPDAVLSCLKSCMGNGAKYADITADDFLQQRLREIGLIG